MLVPKAEAPKVFGGIEVVSSIVGLEQVGNFIGCSFFVKRDRFLAGTVSALREAGAGRHFRDDWCSARWRCH